MTANDLGQLFFVGIPGPELDAETRSLLEEVKPGGICLFARNIQSAVQTRALTDGLKDLLGRDVLISLDQEGGRVDRLRRILEPMPTAASLNSHNAARTAARLTAAALLNLGFNMNFAPVVDVESGGRDCSRNGLATRCFGNSANEASDLSGAYLMELEAAGVMGCLKHFPGLGASTVDSHEELPTVSITRETFEAVDLVPYRKQLSRGFKGAVMTAHAVYPLLDEQISDAQGNQLPSSLNPRFISGLLRSTLGFDGVVMTDDLEMGAIIRNYGIGEAAVMALTAGNDQVLICNDPENIKRAFAAVSLAADKGELESGLIDNAIRRVYALRRATGVPRDFSETSLVQVSDSIIELKSSLAEI